MKYILVALAISFCSIGFSQTNNNEKGTSIPNGFVKGVGLKDITNKFAVVKFNLDNNYSRQFQIPFDYGQGIKNNMIKDAKGEDISFESLGQLLNYLNDNGWKLSFTLSSQTYNQLIFENKNN